MARKALEAVFGALGSGLIGYGRDEKRRFDEAQTEMDREERRKRDAMRNALTIFDMDLDPTADLQARGRGLNQSAQLAQAAPSVAGMPPMGAVGSALASAGRTMDNDVARGRTINIEGTDYTQPFSRSAQGRAESARRQSETDRAVRRVEGREDAAFESGLRTKEQAAAETARRGGDDRAARADAARRAAAEYIQRARGRVIPASFEGMPPTVIPYKPEELNALRTEVYAEYGLQPSGQWLPEGYTPPPVPAGGEATSPIEQWMVKNRPLTNESPESYWERWKASLVAPAPSASAASPVSSPASAPADTTPTPRATAPDPRTPIRGSSGSFDARGESRSVTSGGVTDRARALQRELSNLESLKRGTMASRDRYASTAERREELTRELLDLGYVVEMGLLRPVRR
jgi:hypothetical protein